MELDALVSEHNIGHVSLVIGMYYVEGMPEGTYRTALALNEKWRAAGDGEIRMVRAFKYHGKLWRNEVIENFIFLIQHVLLIRLSGELMTQQLH